ncbi:hypothetical protein BsWGS_24317 [Bradybaena similaris]
MEKSKRPTSAPKKDNSFAPAAMADELPPAAKKIAVMSSTSKRGESHVSSCIACPVGHESPSEAPVSPSVMSSTSQRGESRVSSCIACPVGHEPPSEAQGEDRVSSCIACPVGHEPPSEAQGEDRVSSCIACPVGHESPSEAPVSPSGYFCTCCSFSTGKRIMLDEHMQQHKLKCPWCPFSSLTHLEVIHHCKFKHGESTDMDSDPCHACVFCDFMTYIMVCLETHVALKHPGEPVKYFPKLVSKKVSSDVRKEDAMFSFSQSIRNENARFSCRKIKAGSHSRSKSNSITIDTLQDVSRNTTHETNSGSVSEKYVKTAYLSTNSINMQLLFNNLFSDVEAPKDLKVECGNVGTDLEVRVAEAPCVEVKLETLYCLTCPFNSVSIDEVKYHTKNQHPVAPAAATYNSNGKSVSVNDTTFFCVRQSCPFSSFIYASYQKHLIDCCADQQTLTVREGMRLKTTIMRILGCLTKYNLCPEDDFCRFASSCLGFSVPTNKVDVSTPGTLGPRSSLSSSNKLVNKSSVASSDHSSRPVTTFNYIPPHNQQTTLAGMQLTYSRQGNIQSQDPTYLGTAPEMQCTPDVPNAHANSPGLEDTSGQFVRILDTFSLSNASSKAPHFSSHTSSNVPLSSNSSLSNVSINSSNLPSNVQNSLRNVSSNAPMNSSHAPSIGNRCLLQAHQIPGNNLSDFLPHQNSNEKQRATFYAGHINRGTASSAHNFLVNTNLASLASQHQPGGLVNSSQLHVTAGSQSQTSVSINSPEHINQGTCNIPQNLPLNTNPVSNAGQHQPGILIDSSQHHGSVYDNLKCTSAAGRPNTRGQERAGSTYQTLPVSQLNPITNRMVIGHPSGIFKAKGRTITVGRKHVSPASQLNAVRGSSFFGRESGNLMAVSLNQGTIGKMNHTFPASQCNTIEDGTVFRQQSGSLMTAGHGQGGCHTSSQYNAIAGRDVQVGQPGMLTTRELKQYPPGNQTYAAPAGEPGTSLGYRQEPDNFMTASLNHSVASNQNQSARVHATCQIVRQETYQKQQCNINPNGPGSSTQEDTSSPNTTLVFDASDSKSKLSVLAYSNTSQSPPASFYQTASSNSLNQAMIQNIPSDKSAEQSGTDSQTGTLKLEPTARYPSSEQNSIGQLSCSWVSPSDQCSSTTADDGAYSADDGAYSADVGAYSADVGAYSADDGAYSGLQTGGGAVVLSTDTKSKKKHRRRGRRLMKKGRAGKRRFRKKVDRLAMKFLRSEY